MNDNTTNIFTECGENEKNLFKQRLNELKEDTNKNKYVYEYPDFLDDVGRNEVRECRE